MPTSLTIQLKGEEGHRHGSYLASLMQGVLMERINPAYAEYLHRTGAHPYSQNIQIKEDRIYWNINALSDDAEQYIVRPILKGGDEAILLTHRQETLQIIDKKVDSISYDEMVQKYYLGSNSRNLTVQFLTPTSFKQSGKYCIFPSSRLIFQSLMMRYDAGAEQSSIFSEERLGYQDHYKVSCYVLNSSHPRLKPLLESAAPLTTNLHSAAHCQPHRAIRAYLRPAPPCLSIAAQMSPSRFKWS